MEENEGKVEKNWKNIRNLERNQGISNLSRSVK
jgi:hypothetical protein